MKKSHLIFVVILLGILVVVATVVFFVREQATQEALDEAGRTLFGNDETPAYVDMLGSPISLETYRGSIIIVNAWASWSPYAVTELPVLDRLAGEFTDKNVVLIAVNRKESQVQAERFLATLPVLPHTKLIIDTNDYFYGVIGGYAMPETVVYDQAGTIVLRTRGTLQLEELRAVLNNLTQQAP